MTFQCEQCKKGRPLARSARSTPSGGGSCSSSGSSCPSKRKCPDKPIYVAADPADETCIVVGSGPPGGSSCSGNGNVSVGGGGGGSGGGFLLRFPGSTCNLKICMLDLSKTNGGTTSRSKDSNSLEIMGNRIMMTGNGLQIVSCKAISGGGGGTGEVQISLAKSQCRGGNIQLSLGKGKGGQSSITCSEPGGQEMEITCRPDARKLNMNHCKPTIAWTIYKRLKELEIEKMRSDVINDRQ